MECGELQPASRHIMWRFVGNVDRESLVFKTDELSIDEVTARAAKWRIDSLSTMIIAALILRRRQEARQGEAGAAMPDAICTF